MRRSAWRLVARHPARPAGRATATGSRPSTGRVTGCRRSWRAGSRWSRTGSTRSQRAVARREGRARRRHAWAGRELGRFYESLLGFGPAVLEPRTVEAMTAAHRYGLHDATFGNVIPWGLGVQIDFTGGTGWRAFGHGGMASSAGWPIPSSARDGGGRQRARRLLRGGAAHADATDAVYTALGDDVARLRRPTSGPRRGGTLST